MKKSLFGTQVHVDESLNDLFSSSKVKIDKKVKENTELNSEKSVSKGENKKRKAVELDDTEEKDNEKDNTQTTLDDKIENKSETDSESDSEKNNKSDSDANSNSDSDSDEEKNKEKDKTISLAKEELENSKKTIFVGNVPAAVISSKSAYKKFKKLFEKYSPIESIRFRSIAFASPLPRKIAYSQKLLHPSRDTVNAYIVFKDIKAVNTSVGELNGTVFTLNNVSLPSGSSIGVLSCHLRVDSVAHPAKQDSRRCIFIGNLDFNASEESLWNHFGQSVIGKIEYVRIIRDKKTNLGKGFAYVQYENPESVEKAIQFLNDKPLKVSESSTEDTKNKSDSKQVRKLRISKAKRLLMNKSKTEKSVSKFKRRKDNKLSQNELSMLGRSEKLLNLAARAKLRAFTKKPRWKKPETK